MRTQGRPACTLLLASMLLPSARQLSAVAVKRRWKVYALDETPTVDVHGPRTFYGGTDMAAEYAARFKLSLIEPPLDLIVKVPAEFLFRKVRFGTLAELGHVGGPVFVKPADPILKTFDAGVYRAVADVRGRRPLDPHTPLLLSDPVEWTSEFRCFIRDGNVEAWSPYLSYGRPVWKPESAAALPASLAGFCDRLVGRMGASLPPAFVVDVGVLEDGQWAVVEFNPAWCSGILGSNVDGVLAVVERSAMSATDVSPADRPWIRLGR